MKRSLLFIAFASSTALPCACEGSGATPSDLELAGAPRCGSALPAAPVPALSLDGARRRAFFTDHPLPLLQDRGGPVLSRPHVVGVFLHGDPLKSSSEAMLQSYGCSPAWRASVAEYGVGDITYDRSVEVAKIPPFDDESTIEDWLTAGAKAGSFGPLEEETVVVAFLPEGISSSPGDCKDRFGYHSEIDLGSSVLVYAVVLRCANTWMTKLDELSRTVSHELIEAVMDPFPNSKPAWRGLDVDESVWAPQPEANEGADVCDGRTIPSDGYPLPTATAWSNRRARAGLDACGPSPSPFFIATAQERSIDLSSGPVSLAIDVYSEDPTLPVEINVLHPNDLSCVSTTPESPPGVHFDGEVVRFQLGAPGNVLACSPDALGSELSVQAASTSGMLIYTTVAVTGLPLAAP